MGKTIPRRVQPVGQAPGGGAREADPQAPHGGQRCTQGQNLLPSSIPGDMYLRPLYGTGHVRQSKKAGQEAQTSCPALFAPFRVWVRSTEEWIPL